MRAVVQRVSKASVIIDEMVHSEIKKGLLVLLGISIDDNEEDISYIIDKIINLRIFNDFSGKMNENISSFGGEILVVSQFTLLGDARKGRRPSYSNAANGEDALEIYKDFIAKLEKSYESLKIKTGKFQAMMKVELVNDGPVTILLDSKRLF